MPSIHDYGVPIQRAAEVSGWEGGSFYTLLFRGVFGPAPTEPSVAKAPLLHVAAATALKQAENAGAHRQEILPFLSEIADAIYVRLAMLELSGNRWHSVTSQNTLRQKLRTGDCQSEIAEMLALGTRQPRRFMFFGPDGPRLAHALPENSGSEVGAAHLDAWRIAEQLQVRTVGMLFY